MRSVIARLTLLATFVSLFPVQVFAQEMPQIEDINPSTVSQGDTVTVFGTGFQSEEASFTPVLYPQGDFNESLFHYPTPQELSPNELRFVMGAGEGASLEPGRTYTFNFLFNGDTVSSGRTITLEGDTNTGGFTLDSGNDNTTVEGIVIDGATPSVPNGLELVMNCSDTDENDDIYVQGETTAQTGKLYDYCGEDDKTVYQTICRTGTEAAYDQGTVCEHGCLDGICKKAPATPTVNILDGNDNTVTIPLLNTTPTISTCTDTDSKNDMYKKGTVSANGDEVYDVCDGDELFQVQCKNGNADFLDGKKCQNGCSKGACIRSEIDLPKTTTASCKDSDSKNDIYKKGTVAVNGDEVYDVCDGDELIQVQCKNGEADFLDGKKCQNGCSKGVCLRSEIDEDDLPKTTPVKVDPFVETLLELPVKKLTTKIEREIVLEKREEKEEKFLEKLEKLTDEKEVVELALKSGKIDFKDVPQEQWFFNSVRRLSRNGAVSGYKDKDGNLLNEFRPASKVNVAESLKIVLESAGKGKKTDGTPSNEKARTTWAKDYFAKADDLKLDAAGFEPGRSATRGEIACMMADTFGLNAKNDQPLAFGDVAKTHKNYRCLKAVFDAGIMKGDDTGNTMRPDDGINRAEMSAMTDRALNLDALANAGLCPVASGLKNLLVYEVDADLIEEKGKPKMKNGNYFVKMKAGFLNTALNNTTIKGLKVRLFRHDVVRYGDNWFREEIKEMKTPSSWKALELEPGRYGYVNAIVPIPKDTYLAASISGGTDNVLDFARLSVAIDIPENSVPELFDVSDNFATSRVWLTSHSKAALADGFTQRVLHVGKDSSKVSGSQQAELFTSYDKVPLNAFKSYQEVFTTYFRSLKGNNLELTSSGCVNFSITPGSFKITQKSVDNASATLKIDAEIVKSGAFPFDLHSIQTGRIVLYMVDKGSKTPMRPVNSWPLDSIPEFNYGKDKGTKDLIKGKLSEEFKVKTFAKDVMFTLIVDDEDEIVERNESDNVSSVSHSFTGLSLASCNFDPKKSPDVWVMGTQQAGKAKKSGSKYVTSFEALIQSGYKDVEDVNIHLFKATLGTDRYNQIEETIREVAVPDSWKKVDLTAGRIKTLKTDVVIDESELMFNDAVTMADGNKGLGVYYIVVADLPENSIKEIEEVENNIAAEFVAVDSAASKGRRYEVNVLKNFVRKIYETTASNYLATKASTSSTKANEFASYLSPNTVKALYDDVELYSESFKKHFAKVHKISSANEDYNRLCTNLEATNVKVESKGNTDRALKVDVDVELKKYGGIPLPKTFKAAQLYYRPAGTNDPFRITYTWNSSDLKKKTKPKPNTGGIVLGATAQEDSSGLAGGFFLDSKVDDPVKTSFPGMKSEEYTLSVDGLSIAPYSSTTTVFDYDFKVSLDHENVIPEVNEKDNSKTLLKRLKSNAKVDLAGGSLTLGEAYLDKNTGQPKVDIEYEIKNLGTQDVTTEFQVSLKSRDGSLSDTWPVFEVKNGLHKGKRTLTLPRNFEDEYGFETEIDTTNVIIDQNRNNNSTIWSNQLLKFKNDVTVDIELKETVGENLTNSTKWDFYDLVSTADYAGNKKSEALTFNAHFLVRSNESYKDISDFNKNGQKHSLTFYTKKRPFDWFAEPPYLRLKGISEWIYEEMMDNEGMIFRGGIARIDCGTNCGLAPFNNRIFLTGSNGLGISKTFMYDDTAYEANTTDSYDDTRIYNYNTHEGVKDNDHKERWDHKTYFRLPKEDGKYLLYGGIVKHWKTQHYTDDRSNNKPGLGLWRTTEQWRQVEEAPFKDAYLGNNYDFIYIEVKNGVVMQKSRIDINKAYQLLTATRGNLKDYKNKKVSGYDGWPASFGDVFKHYKK